MATLTRRTLSASANGRPIAIVATSSPGTALHVVTATGVKDHLELRVINNATTWRTVTIEWGGTSSDDQSQITLEPQAGLYKVSSRPLSPFSGSGGTATVTIAAFGTATFGLGIMGFVDRIA